MAQVKDITRKALGRVYNLGAVYDVCEERFVHGTSLYGKISDEDVQLVECPDYNSKLSRSDSVTSKLTDLDIGAELKVSILGGLISLNGSAKYARRAEGKKNKVSVSLLVNVLTAKETIDVFKMDKQANQEVIKAAVGTHVVSGIQWGARAIVTFSAIARSKEHAMELGGKLEASLDNIPCLKAEAKVDIDFKEVEKESQNGISVEVHADMLPDTGPPKSVEDALEFITKMPALTKANNGKGRPVEYELSPLSCQTESNAQSISEITSHRIGQIFDELGENKELFRETWKDVESVSDVLDANFVREFKEFDHKIKIAEKEFEKALQDALLGVRSRKTVDEKQIEAELHKFETSSHCSHESIKSFLDDHKPKVKGKMDAYLYARQLGVPFLQKDENLRSVIDTFDGDLYVLFSDSGDKSADQRSRFLSYKKRKAPDANYLMVDFDLHDNLKQSPMVKWYKNGQEQICFVRPIDPEEKYYDNEWKKDLSQPLRIQCPRAMLPEPAEEQGDQPGEEQKSISACPNEEVTWRCFRCRKEVTVNRDKFDYIFCGCGSVEIDKCGFRCDDPAHGDKLVPLGKNRKAIIKKFLEKSEAP